jgi:hypothetical protein
MVSDSTCKELGSHHTYIPNWENDEQNQKSTTLLDPVESDPKLER